MPAEGCVGELREAAVGIVTGGCNATGASGAKADGGGFRWLPVNRRFGRRKDVPTLKEAARISGLREACPTDRQDALCEALRQGDDATAAETVQWAVAQDPELISDAAVRCYVRERTLALEVCDSITELGPRSLSPSQCRSAPRAAILEQLPATPRTTFPWPWGYVPRRRRTPAPPRAAC